MKKVHRAATPRLLAAGTAAAAILLSAGCGSSSSGSSGPADPNGTIVFGITADPTQMVPWTSTSVQSTQVLDQIYSTLLTTDDNEKLTPGLAQLPTVSKDGKTYTFKLHSGVKFADGSTLDSQDVKYTFDTIMNPKSAATSASYFASVASVAAPDPQTVVVTLKTPDASFPNGLTAITTGIVPSGATANTLSTKPDGSGPYQFSTRTPNESITLKRNSSYFAGKPGAAKLEFRVIPDDQSLVGALKSGSVDLAIFDNPVTAKTATSPKVTVKTVDTGWYRVLQLRATSPVLSNVNTRLAIQCAISRQQVIDTAALGAGKPTGPITSPQYASDPTSQPCPDQDLTKARAYLAKAGKPKGFTLNLMTSQGLYSTAVDEAQNVQAQLGKIDIKVKVETLDSNTYVQRWLAGNFDAAIASNAGSVDPNTMYARYFTSTGSFQKVAGYSSPTLDKLFAQGIATTDPSARKAIYDKISAQLVDNAAWVWLYSPEYFIAANSGVHNLDARRDADVSTLWKASIS